MRESPRHNIEGPAAKDFNPQKAYAPVDCDFTDELEHFSVKKVPVEIRFFTADGNEEVAQGLITDILIRDQAEYVILSSGTDIRLDRIKSLRPSGN